MSFFDHTVLCTLTGADPGESLHAISKAGIPVREITRTDDLTVRFRCPARCRSQIQRMLEKRGDSILFSHPKGWGTWMKAIKNRPVLVFGALFFLILSLYLPTRVFFFSVEGNERISARQILEAAENSGICFGVSRDRVRSEKMKNALLAALPQLQWAGINTKGCVAVISVREKTVSIEMKTFETTLRCLRRRRYALSPMQIPQEGLIAKFATLLIQYTGT